MNLEPLTFAVRPSLSLSLPPASEPVLLPVQRTPRPYPLKEFIQASPALDSNLAQQSPGVPLTLALRLQDARGQAIRRAAVYVWHYDPSCWTLDVQDDDLRTIALMRGVQVSDETGDLVFHTVYPGRYIDNSVPVYLRVYFNDGRHVLARADGCLLLPAQPAAVADELQIAPAALPTLRKPAPLDARSALNLRPDRVLADPEGGGLRAELVLRIDLDSTPRTH